MAAVRNRQMARKDRHRIAQNEIVVPVEDRLLFRREIVRAEETGAAPDGFRIELRPAADDPPRIELDFARPSRRRGSRATWPPPGPHTPRRGRARFSSAVREERPPDRQGERSPASRQKRQSIAAPVLLPSFRSAPPLLPTALSGPGEADISIRSSRLHGSPREGSSGPFRWGDRPLSRDNFGNRVHTFLFAIERCDQ